MGFFCREDAGLRLSGFLLCQIAFKEIGVNVVADFNGWNLENMGKVITFARTKAIPCEDDTAYLIHYHLPQ